MSVNELKNDYLLSIGCSIADKYVYIRETGYKFFKNEDDGFVSLGNKRVPLNSKIKDNLQFNRLLSNANAAFARNIAGEIQKKLGNADPTGIVDVCGVAANGAKIYFADVIKYSLKVFDLDETALKRLITISDASMRELAEGFGGLLKKHNINVNRAMADAARTESNWVAGTIAEASAAPSYTYGTTYFSDAWGGSAYSVGYTRSTMSEGQIRSDMAVHSMLAKTFEESDIKVANKKAVEDMNSIIDNVIGHFTETAKEIISVCAPDFFISAIECGSKDIEQNPTNANALYNEIANLPDSDFPDLKRVLLYYDINFTNKLNNNLGAIMFDHYTKTGKCDYDSSYLRFYRYIMNGGEDFYVEQAAIRCYNKFINSVDSTARHAIAKKYRNNAFKEELEEIEKCSYIAGPYRKKLYDFIEKSKASWKARKAAEKKIEIRWLVKHLLLVLLIGGFIAVSNLMSGKVDFFVIVITPTLIYMIARIIIFIVGWRN